MGSVGSAEKGGPALRRNSASSDEKPVKQEEDEAGDEDEDGTMNEFWLSSTAFNEEADAVVKPASSERMHEHMQFVRERMRAMEHKLAEKEPPPPPRCWCGGRASFDRLRNLLDLLATFVVFSNVVWVWYVADLEIARAGTGETVGSTDWDRVELVNWLFTGFFAVEIAMRLCVNRSYFFCGPSKYSNALETMLVISSFATLAGSFTFLRALRIIRLGQVFRLWKHLSGHFRSSLTDLVIMINCLCQSFSLLVWCAGVIFLITVLFAMYYVQVITMYLESDGEANPGQVDAIRILFGSVGTACLTLFMAVTGGLDWRDIYNTLQPVGVAAQLPLVLYITLYVIAVWNIVTSTFVEKSIKLAKHHNDAIAVQQDYEQQVNDALELRHLFEAMDLDCSGFISHDEFTRCMKQPEFTHFLEVRGLHITDVGAFFGAVAQEKHELDLQTIVDCCMRIRGDATSLDLHMLRHELVNMHKSTVRELRRLAKKVPQRQDGQMFR